MPSPSSYSPLALAFLGDTVFDLLVRKELLGSANRPVKDLHNLAASKVCAAAQAAAVKKILPLLDDEGAEGFKRGRNAHPGSVPKNQSVSDYHYATGLEALFGWLYLSGNTGRIQYLYNIIAQGGEENEKTG